MATLTMNKNISIILTTKPIGKVLQYKVKNHPVAYIIGSKSYFFYIL